MAKKPLVLITGASSGIGLATAKLFGGFGYSLGLFSRQIKTLQALNIPKSLCIATDVTDAEAFQYAVQTAEKTFGPVDCLINNAGFSKQGEFTSLPHTDHEAMIQTNLLGVIHGIEAVLPGMQARKTGTIINITSLADRHPRPEIATYAAAKAAVKSLNESLQSANAQYGIRICTLAPAKVKTAQLKDSALTQEQLITVETIAKTILWVYEQPQTVCIRDIVIAPTYYEA